MCPPSELVLNSLQGVNAVGQKQTVEEIRDILAVMVRWNEVSEVVFSQQLLFASWSQLVKITLHTLVGGGGEWNEPGRITLLFDVIQDLLLKVKHCEPGQLSAAIHETMMILMAHLRQEITSVTKQEDNSGFSLSPIYAGLLQAILGGLFDKLLKCPSGMQQQVLQCCWIRSFGCRPLLATCYTRSAVAAGVCVHSWVAAEGH